MGEETGSPIGEPDWQDYDSYDYTETLLHDGWAWEFLRRNPNYRAEWLETSRIARRLTDASRWGLLTFCRSRARGSCFLAF